MKRGPDGVQPRTAEAEEPRVSVIVAAHDAEPTIDDLLAALDLQTLSSSDYEVLVSDDGSGDGTQAMVRESRSARLIEAAPPGRRLGAYSARNLALEPGTRTCPRGHRRRLPPGARLAPGGAG